MTSIVRLAPQLLAGSALVGFGFAFGRDIYRETKKHWVFALLFVALASFLYGLFWSSVWLARNYRTRLASIGSRLAASCAFVVCYCVLLYVSFLLIEVASGTTGATNTPVAQPTELWNKHAGSLTDGSPLSVGFIVQNLLVLAGLILGLTQRRKRRLLWTVEKSNESFIADHGLQPLDDENMRDSEGNRFRLAKTFTHINEIEFIAVGQAGKAGYLRYDGAGKYISWSGLVSIR